MVFMNVRENKLFTYLKKVIGKGGECLKLFCCILTFRWRCIVISSYNKTN